MTKDEILELIRNGEAESYENLRECEEIYGSRDAHTRYAAGAWGAIIELLQTIEENEKAN